MASVSAEVNLNWHIKDSDRDQVALNILMEAIIASVAPL
jgi:hypothetical protein